MKLIQINPSRLSEKPDMLAPKQGGYCVPCALSVILDKPYEYVNSWLLKRGYRRTAKSGTDTASIDMSQIGLACTNEEHARFKGMTVNRFAQLNLPGEYLIQVNSHCCAYKNGIVYDTTDSSKRKIKRIWIKRQNKVPSDFGVVLSGFGPEGFSRAKQFLKTKAKKRGDKKQQILSAIAYFKQHKIEYSVKQVAEKAGTSYIYARWILKDNN